MQSERQFDPPVTHTEVISPFADQKGAILEVSPRPGRAYGVLLGAGAAILAIAGGLASYFYVKDPYRTLEVLQVAKYLDNYHSMAGSRYRATLRVEADLGWKEGIGRLMLFSAADDARPIAVMIPAATASGVQFSKSQAYEAELSVKEGGLIYANSVRKM